MLEPEVKCWEPGVSQKIHAPLVSEAPVHLSLLLKHPFYSLTPKQSSINCTFQMSFTKYIF